MSALTLANSLVTSAESGSGSSIGEEGLMLLSLVICVLFEEVVADDGLLLLFNLGADMSALLPTEGLVSWMRWRRAEKKHTYLLAVGTYTGTCKAQYCTINDLLHVYSTSNVQITLHTIVFCVSGR